MQEYFHLEDIQGVGQGMSACLDRWPYLCSSARTLTAEHLICLNRGEEDTGHIWFENVIARLAQQTRQRRPTPRDGDPGSTSRNGTDERADDERLNVHVWWGSEDKMVPVQGQGELAVLLCTRNIAYTMQSGSTRLSGRIPTTST